MSPATVAAISAASKSLPRVSPMPQGEALLSPATTAAENLRLRLFIETSWLNLLCFRPPSAAVTDNLLLPPPPPPPPMLGSRRTMDPILEGESIKLLLWRQNKQNGVGQWFENGLTLVRQWFQIEAQQCTGLFLHTNSRLLLSSHTNRTSVTRERSLARSHFLLALVVLEFCAAGKRPQAQRHPHK